MFSLFRSDASDMIHSNQKYLLMNAEIKLKEALKQSNGVWAQECRHGVMMTMAIDFGENRNGK